MSSQDYIYCYQGKALRVPGGTAVIGEVYHSPVDPFDSVTIGNQTWMSKNLAINDGGSGILTKTVNYGQGDVTEYYYTWDAAVRVAATVQGWHLPSGSEWDSLAMAVGGSSTAGTKLKSTYGWSSGNGTNDFGFAAFPAGFIMDGVDGVLNFGTHANLWQTNEITPSRAYTTGLYTTASVDLYSATNKANAFSVRLVKDSE